jgi:hypothetical protein
MAPVKRFAAFIAVGSFFATVEEFLTVIILRRDIGAYVATLSVPVELKFAAIISLIIIGYFILNMFFVRYLVHAFTSKPVAYTSTSRPAEFALDRA